MWLWWNYFAGNKNFFRLPERHEDVKYCYSDLVSIGFIATLENQTRQFQFEPEQLLIKGFCIFSFILTNLIIFVLSDFVEIINEMYLYCTKAASLCSSNTARGCLLASLSCTACTSMLRGPSATEITWASSAYPEQYCASHISLSDCASPDKIFQTSYLPPIHLLGTGHGASSFCSSIWLFLIRLCLQDLHRPTSSLPTYSEHLCLWLSESNCF